MKAEKVSTKSHPFRRKCYSTIGILGNKKYSSYLEKFRSKNVLVFTETEATSDDLKAIIKNNDKLIKGTVLWLACTGICSLADDINLPICNENTCKNPLCKVLLKNSFFDKKCLKTNICNLIRSMESLVKEVKSSCLKEGSHFLLMPPFPICVLSMKFFNHDQLHAECLDDTKIFSIVSKDHQTIFLHAYIKFCSEMRKTLNQLVMKHPAYLELLMFYKKLNYASVLKPTIERDNNMVAYRHYLNQFIQNSLNGKLCSVNEKNRQKCTVSKSDQTNIYKKYDITLFIGNQSSLKYLSHTLSSDISILCINFPLNWLNIYNRIAVYRKKYKKILFIFVADISIISAKVFEDNCRNSCDSKIPSHILKSKSVESMVKGYIHDILNMKAKLENSFKDKYCVWVTPLFPRYGIRKPSVDSEMLHQHMHKVSLHSSQPLLLNGQISVWKNSIDILKDMWCKNFAFVSSRFLALSEQDETIYQANPIVWHPFNESSSLEKKSDLLEDWGKNVTNVVNFFSRMPSPKVFTRNASHKNINNTSISMNTQSLACCKSSDQATGGYIIGQNNFLEILNDLKIYENINFLRKSLSNANNLEVSSLLCEIGSANQNQVCFFIFDLTYITTEIRLKECVQLGCKDNHISLAMPYSGKYCNTVTGCQGLVDQYLSQIDAFLKLFNVNLVGLPLPLPPSQFCNLNGIPINNNHSNVEWMYKQAHFVSGAESKWKIYMSTFQVRWNVLMKAYYSRFSNAMEILNSYIEKTANIYTALNKKDQYKGDVTIYEEWINVVKNIVLTTTKYFNPKEMVQPVQNKNGAIQGNIGTNFSSGDWSHMSNENQVRNIHTNASPHEIPLNEISIQPIQPPMQYGPEYQQPHEQYPQNLHKIAVNIPSQQKHTVAPLLPRDPLLSLPRDPLLPLPRDPLLPLPRDPLQRPEDLKKSLNNNKKPLPNNIPSQTPSKSSNSPLILSFIPSTTKHNDNKQTKTKSPGNITLENSNEVCTSSQKPDAKIVGTRLTVGNAEIKIYITGFTDIIAKFILCFVNLCSNNQAKVLDEKEDFLKFLLPYEAAHLIACKLKNHRIFESYFEVQFCDKGMHIEKPSDPQYNFAFSCFKASYLKFKDKFVDDINEQLSVLDILSFKTEKCSMECHNKEVCSNYHSNRDRRRNPILHSYSQLLCGITNKHSVEDCKFSHNLFEKMYHPKVYQTMMCKASRTREACSRLLFCFCAHTDSPELFFTKNWVDLLLFDVRNTYVYLCGALRASIKLPPEKSPKIFCVSSKLSFLKLLQTCLNKHLNNYKADAFLLNNNKRIEFSEKPQIFFGTPSMFMSSSIMVTKVNGKYEPSVLIIDDVLSIFKDHHQNKNLNSLFHRLKSSPINYGLLQKVFVVPKYSEDVSKEISTKLGVELKAVKNIFTKTAVEEKSLNTTINPSISAIDITGDNPIILPNITENQNHAAHSLKNDTFVKNQAEKCLNPTLKPNTLETKSVVKSDVERIIPVEEMISVPDNNTQSMTKQNVSENTQLTTGKSLRNTNISSVTKTVHENNDKDNFSKKVKYSSEADESHTQTIQKSAIITKAASLCPPAADSQEQQRQTSNLESPSEEMISCLGNNIQNMPKQNVNENKQLTTGKFLRNTNISSVNKTVHENNDKENFSKKVKYSSEADETHTQSIQKSVIMTTASWCPRAADSQKQTSSLKSPSEEMISCLGDNIQNIPRENVNENKQLTTGKSLRKTNISSVNKIVHKNNDKDNFSKKVKYSSEADESHTQSIQKTAIMTTARCCPRAADSQKQQRQTSSLVSPSEEMISCIGDNIQNMPKQNINENKQLATGKSLHNPNISSVNKTVHENNDKDNFSKKVKYSSEAVESHTQTIQNSAQMAATRWCPRAADSQKQQRQTSSLESPTEEMISCPGNNIQNMPKQNVNENRQLTTGISLYNENISSINMNVHENNIKKFFSKELRYSSEVGESHTQTLQNRVKITATSWCPPAADSQRQTSSLESSIKDMISIPSGNTKSIPKQNVNENKQLTTGKFLPNTNISSFKNTVHENNDKDNFSKKRKYSSEADESHSQAIPKRAKRTTTSWCLQAGDSEKKQKQISSLESFHTKEPMDCHRIQSQESESDEQIELLKGFRYIKAKLLQEHEEETRAFINLPEIHPDYENVLDIFLKNYRMEFDKISDHHRNKKWMQYWEKYINSIKNDHLERKIISLGEVLGLTDQTKPVVKYSPIPIPTSQGDFTVAKTLDILEELKDKFGILGHSLQEMIVLAKKCGTESNEALDVFADLEHAQLCKIIIDKMKVLRNTNQFTGPIYDLAIQWTSQLLDKAAHSKKTANKLDIQAIAIATFGKDPSFTLDVIKSKLFNAGNSKPPKELINKLYLDVCSAHFNMTME